MPLVRDLLKKKLTLVGTLRKNKPELPPQFTVAKGRQIYSTIFGFQNDAMIASYCPKKSCVVNMLSTMHSHPDVDSDSSEKKPEVILYYNSTKSGVDTLDRMDVSAVNAYVIWLQIQNNSTSTISMKKRRTFSIQLEKKLAGIVSSASTPTRRTSQPQSKSKGTAIDDQAPRAKKARCYLRERSKDRKCEQTCISCCNNVCQQHSHVICKQCNSV